MRNNYMSREKNRDFFHMNVSENSGTPKSSILKGFSIINHPFWGTTIFGNTYMVSWLTTKPPPKVLGENSWMSSPQSLAQNCSKRFQNIPTLGTSQQGRKRPTGSICPALPNFVLRKPLADPFDTPNSSSHPTSPEKKQGAVFFFHLENSIWFEPGWYKDEHRAKACHQFLYMLRELKNMSAYPAIQGCGRWWYHGWGKFQCSALCADHSVLCQDRIPLLQDFLSRL